MRRDLRTLISRSYLRRKPKKAGKSTLNGDLPVMVPIKNPPQTAKGAPQHPFGNPRENTVFTY